MKSLLLALLALFIAMPVAAQLSVASPDGNIVLTTTTGADLEADIARLGIGGYYASLSWHCLLAGYGTFPDDAKLKPAEAGLPAADMARIDDFVSRCARNFTDHAGAVAALAN